MTSPSLAQSKTKEDRREFLRRAIAERAFVRDSPTTPIISSESSGIHSQWLFDFRAVMLQPEWLNAYTELFWDTYGNQLPFQVCGMETAGIPLVAAIVMKGVERGTPVNGFFLRKSRKREGLLKQIEGTVTAEPVIMIDDLINSGKTMKKVIDILREAGHSPTDLFTLLAFRAPSAYEDIETLGVHCRTLFGLPDFGLANVERKSDIPEHGFEALWRFAAPNPSFHLVVHKSSPCLDRERVFFGTAAGVFYALNQHDGSVAWKFSIEVHPPGKGILSSPALHNGTVYFGAYDGVVYALDAKTGSLRWRYDNADWVGSSPSIAPELNFLFIGLEFGLFRKRGGIAALDLETGREVWRAITPELTHGSPLFIREEHMTVIGSNDGVVYAYDAKTGTEKWRYQTAGNIKLRPAYDSKTRQVFVASMDGNLYALSAATGEPLHARQTGAGIYAAPLVANGVVYAASLDKKLYAIDIAIWKDRWIFSTNGRIFASPEAHGESIWVGSNDGRLYEINPETGTLRSFFQATERILTKPTFSEDGNIFFGTVADELYCIRENKIT